MERTPAELPVIACSLEQGELAERRARWEALATDALVERAETSDGLRLSFRARPEVERELRELAELERECCGFARFEVRPAGAEVVLDVTAPAEAVPAVQAMFS